MIKGLAPVNLFTENDLSSIGHTDAPHRFTLLECDDSEEESLYKPVPKTIKEHMDGLPMCA